MVVILIPAVAVSAQSVVLVDLESPIYRDLQRWEAGGYIDSLPRLQPYSHIAITSRLRKMLATENLPDNLRKRAEEHLLSLNNSDPQIQLGIKQFLRSTERESYFNLRSSAGFTWLLSNSDAGSTRAELSHRVRLIDAANMSALPLGARETEDWIADKSDIEVFNKKIQILQFPYGLVSFASQDADGLFSFSAGIHRSEASPFYDDGILISSQAPAAGHFVMSYDRLLEENEGFIPRLIYSAQLSLLSATDDNGAGIFGQKYLMYHSLYADVLPWLGIGFIEAVVWGGQFELLYLIPISSYFLSQGLGGFNGNSLMGIEATFRPVQNLHIPLVIFVDDIHFNDLVRFQFNTKYKFAAQTGIRWTPLLPWLDQLSADYTAVMPYMYAHWDKRNQLFDETRGGTPNYSNYTHHGTNIGPGLDPNSDRWRLKWTFRPLDHIPANWLYDFSLTAGIQLIRHGNASAGIIDQATGDIFDPGYRGSTPTFQAPFSDLNGQPYTRFLTQGVIEHNLQFSIRAYGAFQITPEFKLDLEVEYSHAQIWNTNLVKDNHTTANYISVNFGTFH